MKVKVIKGKDWSGYHETQDLYINDEFILDVRPLNECPEDAFIGRDLIPCTKIANLMEKAWQAGKDNEPFDYSLVIQEEDR